MKWNVISCRFLPLHGKACISFEVSERSLSMDLGWEITWLLALQIPSCQGWSIQTTFGRWTSFEAKIKDQSQNFGGHNSLSGSDLLFLSLSFLFLQTFVFCATSHIMLCQENHSQPQWYIKDLPSQACCPKGVDYNSHHSQIAQLVARENRNKCLN